MSIYCLFFSTRKEVEKCKNKKMKYDFAYYILVCKTYRQKGQKNSPLFYTNAEEEFLHEVYRVYKIEQSVKEKIYSKNSFSIIQNLK